MMRRRRRSLSPEERALWDQVARTAEPLPHRPLKKERAVPSPTPAAPVPPAAAPIQTAPPLPAFRVGERAVSPRNGTAVPALPATKPPRMDARTHKRMRKGRVAPEARIDLHGMTLAQAHGALIGFILSSRAQQRRLVLVITGKGRPRGTESDEPPRRGLLRQQVPDWLTLPPLADLVLDVTQAHASHGGAGALYVYLRRR